MEASGIPVKKAGAARKRGVALLLAGAALFMPSHAAAEKTELDAALQNFYEAEAARHIEVKKPGNGPVNFDIIFLNICSMSWDDLKEVKLDSHPLFKQFQYLYTNFNSVTTYSGPAMMRLLKANCGQASSNTLYNDMPRECYTMDSLENIGFQPWTALNHNGQYGNFARDLAATGKLHAVVMDTGGLQSKLTMFDGSPIYDDYAVLERWWNLRLRSDKPAALYYNTVTLHDGAHWADDRFWFTRDRKAVYRSLASKQLDDLERFFALLEKSGRNAVVVFVPEHGQALRGAMIQAPGLRDIPLPSITNVPVGIKLIGKGYAGRPAQQTVIGKPASMLAIAYQLAAFISRDPFENGGAPARMPNDIPATDPVSENQNATVLRFAGKYYLLGKDRGWTELRANQIE